MNISIVFLLGLSFAFVGVIPPGMLNMSAAKISLKEGHARGFVFSIGVCVIVGVQTYLALIFAKYLNQHPDVVDVLKRVALVLFILISIYFFLLAKSDASPQEVDASKSKKSRFFQGVLMSALNVFPIPYQAYIVTTLLSYQLLSLDNLSIGSYIAGATSGTFIALYIYILFFDKIKNSKITSPKRMNYCIGIITAIVSITTLVSILKTP
ncbi:MAG: LysE family transporter [Flavobacteriaceae bacterium]|nr:LysE family transporter [Flavobacteriaceae bacterium]MDA7849077.1 LysE family transporter [Flavobacteriaceae bacterium]MDG1309822.1 LysE family transporter [Flavobacteriaceae bacterium]